MKYIMVLNDGETFSDLHQCGIYTVEDDYDGDTVPENADAVCAFTVNENGDPEAFYNGEGYIMVKKDG